MPNWKTSIFGLIAALSLVAHGFGIHIGHLGAIDFTQLIGAMATGAVGVLAADAKPQP